MLSSAFMSDSRSGVRERRAQVSLLQQRHSSASRQLRIEILLRRRRILQIRVPKRGGGDLDRVDDALLLDDAVLAARSGRRLFGVVLPDDLIRAIEALVLRGRQRE